MSLLDYIREGNIARVTELLNQGQRITSDVFMEAVKHNRVEMVELFLERGADSHFENELALREACQRNYTDIIDLLLTKNPNVHADNDSALRSACLQRNVDVIRKLLQRGADPNVADGRCLQLAIIARNIEMIMLLLQYGANPNIRSDILLSAINAGNPDIVEYLIRNGARITKVDFIQACQTNNVNAVRIFLENGFDPNDRDILFRTIERGNEQILQLILQSGIEEDILNEALSIASFTQKVGCVRLLLEYGARNENAISIAVSKNNLAIVELLVEYGASLASKSRGLVDACRLGYLNIVRFLIEHDADVNFNFGEPMRVSRNLEIIQLLEREIERRDRHRRERMRLEIRERAREEEKKESRPRVIEPPRDPNACNNPTDSYLVPIQNRNPNVYTMRADNILYCYTREEMIQIFAYARLAYIYTQAKIETEQRMLRLRRRENLNLEAGVVANFHWSTDLILIPLEYKRAPIEAIRNFVTSNVGELRLIPIDAYIKRGQDDFIQLKRLVNP